VSEFREFVQGWKEFTYMRFTVEVNKSGFPEDVGEALAAEVKAALLATAKEFDPDAVVKEDTE
jgi:hypothetical protein